MGSYIWGSLEPLGNLRRRQRRGQPCLLGCGRGEDSIQHYSGCAITRAFGQECLGLVYRFCLPLEEWLLAGPQHKDADEDEHWWHKLAILQYVVMRATNSIRAQQRPPAAFDVRRILDQALIESVRDSPNLAGVVHSRGHVLQ